MVDGEDAQIVDGKRMLNRADYYVDNIAPSRAKRFIAKHHYAAGTSNTATFCHGLFTWADIFGLHGAAIWIPPTPNAAAFAWPAAPDEVIGLSRLAIAPGQPQNAASFLIAGSLRIIRKDGRFKCAVTYADQWKGHTGAIYRATNWEYMGQTEPQEVWTDSTGRLVTKKSNKCRTTAEMIALGHRLEGRFRKHRFRMVL